MTNEGGANAPAHGRAPYRFIVPLSLVRRFDLFLKVEALLDEDEDPRRLAEEICRQLLKTYGVRAARPSPRCSRRSALAPSGSGA